jgi:hypothetical protein
MRIKKFISKEHDLQELREMSCLMLQKNGKKKELNQSISKDGQMMLLLLHLKRH